MRLLDLLKNKKPVAEKTIEQKDKPLILDEVMFNKIKTLFYDNHGFYLPDHHLKELERQAALKVMANNYHSFDQYYMMLKENQAQGELVELLAAINIERKFFYPEEFFKAVISILIPDIINKKERNTLKITFIDAGDCQDAYTVAMLFLVYIKPFLPDYTFEFVAVEKDHELINKAKERIYTFQQIKEVPETLRNKYFSKVEDDYLLSEEVSSLINLIHVKSYENLPAELNNADIIFCRGYISPLNKMERNSLITGLYDTLAAGGYFITGEYETLHGMEHNFKVIHLPKNIVYKK